MKKVFFRIHQILGLAIGLLISLICLTGAILVFEDECRELASPQLYFVSDPPVQARLEPSEVVEHINRTLEDDAVARITVPSDTTRNYVVQLQRGDKSLYVNPYTATVAGQRGKRDGFFGDVMRLHRWLLDGSRTWGKAIVGYGVLLFIFILISGIVIWVPKSVKNLKQHFQIKTKASRQRMWYDSHRSLGIYLAIPLLILCITGLNWSFPWWRSGLYGLFGTQFNSSKSGKTEEKKELVSINYLAWQEVFRRLEAQHPSYRQITLENGEASVAEQFTWGNPRASEKYRFDQRTGEITEYTPYTEQPRQQKVRGWIYAVHVGSWGGWFIKSITFLVALLGATLPLTGYYIYWVKRKQRKKKKQGS